MRYIALLLLLIAARGWSQTIIRYDEPDPDKIRVEKLTDAEVADLAKLSDARQKALDAYLAARDGYEKEKNVIQAKYRAYDQEGDCNKPHIDVEWKGKFIIIEEFPLQGNNITFGGCGSNWIATPISGSTFTLNSAPQ